MIFLSLVCLLSNQLLHASKENPSALPKINKTDGRQQNTTRSRTVETRRNVPVAVNRDDVSNRLPEIANANTGIQVRSNSKPRGTVYCDKRKQELEAAKDEVYEIITRLRGHTDIIDVEEIKKELMLTCLKPHRVIINNIFIKNKITGQITPVSFFNVFIREMEQNNANDIVTILKQLYDLLYTV